MKLRLAFWLILGSLLTGLLFWRNAFLYSSKKGVWLFTKSLSEMFLMFLSAIFLPVILISWICTWLIEPIETPWIKTTVATFSGILLGFLALYAMEVLMVIGIFSIDNITGERFGFLGNLIKAREFVRNKKSSEAAS